MLFETAAHARTPLHLAGSVTGLVGLHVSCFSSGKMKWFGGDKGKDVKCLSCQRVLFQLHFHIFTRTKSHTYVYMYVYTQINYVYTHTYCVLLIRTHASTESGHLFFLYVKAVLIMSIK